ncbi:uncharacterized protein PG998_004024 [Apiospora kogelbergensis]|uniref:uncharacterized protein n=1 Tax=Apiospora kogelbergensis TaxID=1337665 RepID=UPI00312F96AD
MSLGRLAKSDVKVFRVIKGIPAANGARSRRGIGGVGVARLKEIEAGEAVRFDLGSRVIVESSRSDRLRHGGRALTVLAGLGLCEGVAMPENWGVCIGAAGATDAWPSGAAEGRLLLLGTAATTTTPLHTLDDALPIVALAGEGADLLRQTLDLGGLGADEIGAALAAATGGLVIALALLLLVLLGLVAVVLTATLVLLDGQAVAQGQHAAADDAGASTTGNSSSLGLDIGILRLLLSGLLGLGDELLLLGQIVDGSG